jgi:hypothetical protein
MEPRKLCFCGRCSTCSMCDGVGVRAAALDILPPLLRGCVQEGAVQEGAALRHHAPCAESPPCLSMGGCCWRSSTPGVQPWCSRGSVPCVLHLGLACRAMQAFVMHMCCVLASSTGSFACVCFFQGPPRGSQLLLSCCSALTGIRCRSQDLLCSSQVGAQHGCQAGGRVMHTCQRCWHEQGIRHPV